jgi:hypothetical protein
VNALHVHTFLVVFILTRAGGDPVQRLLGQPTAAVVAARISDPAALRATLCTRSETHQVSVSMLESS